MQSFQQAVLLYWGQWIMFRLSGFQNKWSVLLAYFHWTVCFAWSCTSSILWLASRESSPLSDTGRHGEGSPCTSSLTLHLIVIWRASLYLSVPRCPSTDLPVTTRPPHLHVEARARLKWRFGGNIYRKKHCNKTDSDRKWKEGFTIHMSGFTMMSSIPLTQIYSVSTKLKTLVSQMSDTCRDYWKWVCDERLVTWSEEVTASDRCNLAGW